MKTVILLLQCLYNIYFTVCCFIFVFNSLSFCACILMVVHDPVLYNFLQRQRQLFNGHFPGQPK